MNENRCRLPGSVVIAASLLALSGCSLMIPAGPQASEEREIGEVSHVVLDTSGDLVVSEGEPALTVHAPEGVLDRLTSEVDGDTLVLATTPGFTMGFREVRYDLTVPSLELIELNGSGDVDATVSADGTVRVDIDGSGDVDWSGLSAGRVEVRLAGSGDVTLAGSAGELSVDLEGSGSVDAEQLVAEDAVVTLSGSGEVDVSANVSLSVDLSGSGRVTYSGDPSTDVRVSGSGDVVRR
ncbi:head GIN domain-containing protein [Microbacterium sp. LWH3-1.2]|uniref:head GIN domain-containing protein n=1 Tax=Microbacterium sp. LWH3-1.2 TaxID=3135256 RepID=UPI00343A4739